MGIGAILSLAVGVFSAVSQARQAKKARRAQKEARAIEGAGQEIQNRRARRQEAKRLRIQRARVSASARASGVNASSGELGAISAAGSASGAAIANQQSQVLTAQGISAANQRAADAESKAKQIGAFASLLQEGIGLAQDAGKFG